MIPDLLQRWALHNTGHISNVWRLSLSMLLLLLQLRVRNFFHLQLLRCVEHRGQKPQNIPVTCGPFAEQPDIVRTGGI